MWIDLLPEPVFPVLAKRTCTVKQESKLKVAEWPKWITNVYTRVKFRKARLKWFGHVHRRGRMLIIELPSKRKRGR